MAVDCYTLPPRPINIYLIERRFEAVWVFMLELKELILLVDHSKVADQDPRPRLRNTHRSFKSYAKINLKKWWLPTRFVSQSWEEVVMNEEKNFG